MRLRYLIEGAFTVLLTFIFQYYMSLFNIYIHLAMKEIIYIHDLQKHHARPEELHKEFEKLHHELKVAVFDLMEALIFSLIQLFLPFKIMILSFFMNRTNREI